MTDQQEPNAKINEQLEAIKKAITWGAAGIVAVILAISNPSKADLSRHLLSEGWLPMRIERSNLLLFSYNRVSGFTGAQGVYIGICGHYFGGEER